MDTLTTFDYIKLLLTRGKEGKMEGKIRLIRFLESRMKREERQAYGADTILEEIMGKQRGVLKAGRLFDAYQKYPEKGAVEETFFTLTGMAFSEFLNRCTQRMLPQVLKEDCINARFSYQGREYYPFGRIEKGMGIKEISKHLWAQKGETQETWDYDAFYQASGGSKMDLFLCEQTGRLYLPGENELFVWIEGKGGNHADSSKMGERKQAGSGNHPGDGRGRVPVLYTGRED